jgi:large repetitive protein
VNSRNKGKYGCGRNHRPRFRRLVSEPLEARTVLTAPTAFDDFLVVSQDQTLLIEPAALIANDTGAESGGLTTALNLEFGPYAGTLSVQSNGTLHYQPNPGYFGGDSFRYYLGDATGYSAQPATVSIEVRPSSPGSGAFTNIHDTTLCSAFLVVSSGSEHVPRFSVIGECYKTAEDTPLTANAPGVLANDSSEPGITLIAELRTAPMHGSVQLSRDGAFTYEPAQDFFGWDQFVYEVTTAAGQPLLATVFIEVTPVNDAPVVQDDSLPVESGVPLTISAAELKANDHDVDNEWFSAALPLKNLPLHGMLSLRGGNLVYSSDSAFEGTDSFRYLATDGLVFSEREGIVSLTIATPVRHNERIATDVNDDARVTALDFLHVVNYLNAFGPGSVSRAANFSRDLLDVNGDGTVSATDALMIVNELNAGQANLQLPENVRAEELKSAEGTLATDQQISPWEDLLASSGRRRVKR